MGQMWPVERDDALRLLGGVSYGRIVFTLRGLPAVRPVNHIVDGGDVIVRTHRGAAILRTVGQIVAYQADRVAAGPRLVWNVVVIGVVEIEDRIEEITRYERLLRPMVDMPMHYVLRIRPELVSGQVMDIEPSGTGRTGSATGEQGDGEAAVEGREPGGRGIRVGQRGVRGP